MLNNSVSFFMHSASQKIFSSKLQYYALLMLSFSIPFNNILINISAGLLILGWIVQGDYLLSFKSILKSPFLFSLVALFLLYTAGLLYTDNIREGKFVLEKKYPFVIFPLVLGANSLLKLSARDINRILFCFVISCSLVSLSCLARGIYFLLFNHTPEKLFYHELGEIFKLHAVYFSVYLTCASFFLLWLLQRNSSQWNMLQKSAASGLILFFSCMIILLSARTEIAAYVLLLASYIFYIYYKCGKIQI